MDNEFTRKYIIISGHEKTLLMKGRVVDKNTKKNLWYRNFFSPSLFSYNTVEKYNDDMKENIILKRIFFYRVCRLKNIKKLINMKIKKNDVPI